MIAAALLTIYLVRPGDTLSGIAASHHVSLATVEQVNSAAIPDPNVISVGQQVKIPHGNASPSALPVSGGKVHGVTYGDPYTCGDGDGDGWDRPCPNGGETQVTPVTQPQQPQQPQQRQQTSSGVSVSGGSTAIPGWATCIVQAESGGNPRAVNSIPGYIGNGGGLFGDLTSTWNDYDGYPQPFDAPVSVQIQFNDALHARLGDAPWADPCTGRG